MGNKVLKSKIMKKKKRETQRNFLENNFVLKTPRSKIPKPLTTYFIILQLCFGIECGFEEMYDEKKRNNIKRISLLLFFAIAGLLALPMKLFYSRIWAWCTLIKYTSVSLGFKLLKYKMYDFLKDVHSLKEDIPTIDKGYFGVVILAYSSTMYFIKASLVAVYCMYGHSKQCKKASIHMIYTVSYLIVDSFSTILIVILYYVYSFVTHTNNSLESELNLISFERRYTAIAQYYDKIKPLFNYVMLIELCINTPLLMVTLWSMLLYIQENAGWYFYTGEWLFAFHLAIQMCIPCIMAEMANSQIDSIKLTLNEQRRIERDQEKLEDLTRIIRYIKARKLQGDIWRVVPIDLRLPLALCSFCITYLIVILQFSHLYD